MKAFLLAAGYGSRLASLTSTLPKPLVRCAGLPLICYPLAMLKNAGVDEVICNLHYMSSQIISFFSSNNNFGFKVSFSHEDEILGTGGGLKRCEDFFGDEDFFVINSDIITDLDLNKLKEKGAGCVALCRSEAAAVSVENGRVVDFKNALESGVPAVFDYMGAAFLPPRIFRFLSSGFSSIVYTGYTSLAEKGLLGFYEHRGIWIDAGTSASLRNAEKLLAGEASFIAERTRKALGNCDLN